MLGVPLNPFASGKKVEDPYMVRIPINAVPIPAYTKVNRSHMMNAAEGRIAYQPIPPEAAIGMSIVGVDQNGSHVESRVESVKNVNDQVVFVVSNGAEVRQADAFSLGGAILSINGIIGRVVNSDKRAGMGFQESTFFPQGTPEGLAGATPQGMRAITLNASLLTGVHSLNAGDRIDLLASVPLGDSDTEPESNNSEVEMLAQNAKVLRPVYVRNEVTETSSLMSGNSISNVPKYEVAIAVQTDDVIPLQKALNKELPITCIAHSMQPVIEEDQITVSDTADKVQVPVTVRPILAYHVISRDSFVSPATRRLKMELIPRQLADRIGAVTDINEALGAIARQDIPAGRYLRHSDLLNGPPKENRGAAEAKSIASPNFTSVSNPRSIGTQVASPRTSLVPFLPRNQRLPHFTAFQDSESDSDLAAPSATAVGDRPSITTFIPPGRTAFAIPLNRIYGAEHLQIGDVIDLLASFSLERLQDTEETETRPDGTVIVRKSEALSPRTTQRTWEESFGNRAEPWFVASEAIVVAPVGFPAPASALRALNASDGNPRSGSNSRSGIRELDGPPVIIAVESRDVEAVATALASRDALFTVAFQASQPAIDSAEQRTIAVAPESIEAFSELSESSWKGNRRRISTRRVAVSDPRFTDALTPAELSEFYGRVLVADKQRGDVFQASDFFAEGIEPGLAASAREGFTLLPIADREIEGLDSFSTGDRVTILIRGVFRSRLIDKIAPETGIASAYVVAPAVTIVRSSKAGQSVLEIPNAQLSQLQAALARSLTDREDFEDRSHLIAVGLVRNLEDSSNVVDSEIKGINPLNEITTTQVIIGGQSRLEVYAGDGLRYE